MVHYSQACWLSHQPCVSSQYTVTDPIFTATKSLPVCENCGRICCMKELLGRGQDGSIYHKPCPSCNSLVLTVMHDKDGNAFIVPKREVLFQSVESILQRLYTSEVGLSVLSDLPDTQAGICHRNRPIQWTQQESRHH